MKSVVEFIKISNYQTLPCVIMKFRSAMAIKTDPSIVGRGGVARIQLTTYRNKYDWWYTFMFKEFSYIVVVYAEGNHENHIQSIFKDEEGKGHYMYGVFKKI